MHPAITSRISNQVLNYKKKTCHLVDLAVPADPNVKIKENEKIDEYLYVA